MLRIGSAFRLAVTVVLFGIGGEARAVSYDGDWSVVFVSQEGGCREREIEVKVRDGQITHFGGQGFISAEGRVSELGHVEASIGALGYTATAQGHMAEASGRGNWTMPEFG